MPNACASRPAGYRTPRGVRQRTHRSTRAETDDLRVAIHEHHRAGLSIRKIAGLVDKSRSTVHEHLRRARLAAVRDALAAGHAEHVGELLLVLDLLMTESLCAMDSVPCGSVLRLLWGDLAARLLTQKIRLLLRVGLLRSGRARRARAALGLRDWSMASVEEIDAEREHLAGQTKCEERPLKTRRRR